LPKVDGREVLKHIKGHENIRHIPVIVFTSSQRQTDIMYAYSSHANCYIIKPMVFDQYSEIIEKIKEFWFHTATLMEVR